MGDEPARPEASPDSAPTLPLSASGDAPIPLRLGRYVVLDVLGKGGMGIVYSAYDPVLDRRIALKLLREETGEDASAGRVRMHREAQALARLSHANVVPIHDVGDHGSAMYIAMELVQGKTLREWQVGKPWRDVLDAYLAAGRGLAAAHDAGLVHRDFKPDNVLVGDDGRVRVTDFGLARLVADAPIPAAHATPSELATSVTMAGAVMGTVAYMAPEQIDGTSVDARSDQCSWCIAAWEGIYREQPFVGASLELRSTALKTEVPKPPADAKVPRAVARALVRGMSADPAQRWPSMTALIDELSRTTASRRLAIGAAASVALAVVALAFAISRGVHKAPSCEAAGDGIDDTWSPAVRSDLARAFAATGAPFAADALAALDRSMARFRTRWQGIAVDSCRATRIAGTQSEHALDLRNACLVRARDELAAALAGFAHADQKRVADAATFEPPELDACDDVAALSGISVPRGDDIERGALEGRLDELERELHGALALDRTKQLAGIADADIAAANTVGWPVLVARAHRDRAELAVQLGAGKAARKQDLAAAAAASRAGDNDTLASIYLDLADVEARLTSEFGLGASWVELAAGTLDRLGPRPAKRAALAEERGYVAERAGDPETARIAYTEAVSIAAALGPTQEAKALAKLGRAENSLGQLAGATEHLTRALDLARTALGDKHPEIGGIEHDLGVSAYRAGKYDEARRAFQAALAIRSGAFGADSVEAATSLEAIANVDFAQDHVDDAERGFRKAIAMLEARLGPDNPDVLAAYNDLGGAFHRAGRYADALANSQHVLAEREKTLGPDHPDVAESLVNTAIEAKNLGRWDIVDACYPRAAAIFEKAYGATSDEVAVTMINLGEARRAENRLDDAERAYDRARDAIREHHGDDHPMLAHVWNGLGETELARGKNDAAIPLLERAVAMRQHDQGDATDLAESQFALARALPAADHVRAVQLATAARDVYKSSGPGYAARLAAVDAWLRK
ncbi:MAG TPA: serine/threonine-protein kinase [Kofleriaceae bacterium]